MLVILWLLFVCAFGFLVMSLLFALLLFVVACAFTFVVAFALAFIVASSLFLLLLSLLPFRRVFAVDVAFRERERERSYGTSEGGRTCWPDGFAE